MAQNLTQKFSFCSFPRPTEYETTVPVTILSLDAILCLLSAVTKRLYVFAPKIGRGLFKSQRIVRLYRRSRLILAAVYLSRGLFSLV